MSLICPTRELDTIYLRNLHLSSIIGPDAWHRPSKLQPIIVSLQLQIHTEAAGAADDIHQTTSYGKICKDITTDLNGKVFDSLEHLASDLPKLIGPWAGETLSLQISAPKGMLRAGGGVAVEVSWRKTDPTDYYREWNMQSYEWMVKDIQIACIIGVNAHERLEKQTVKVNMRISESNNMNLHAKGGTEHWQSLVKRVCEVTETSSFETLEALASMIARTSLNEFPVQCITISVEKPSAMAFVDGAGVEITRNRTSFASG